MDVRATEEAAIIDTFRDQVNATKFYKPAFRADPMVPKTHWVYRNEKDKWDKIKTIFEFEDWINYKLTGRLTVSLSIAAFRWCYDTHNGGYPTDLYEKLGMDDLIGKLPKDVLKVGERIGNITKEAAAEFGLSEKTVVYEGTCDCNACMFGIGGVLPNGMTLIGGTSTCLLGLTEKDFHVDGVNGTYPDCMYEGTSMLEGGQTASGAILTWFRNNLLPGEWEKEAREKGINIYDYITEKAAEIPIGCEGVVMMDYFQGNRAPYADSKARGMFYGLSIGTTAAHIARSIFEGVAYGANHCIISMNKAGYEVKEIYAYGGITNSPFWMQMHADVIGVPIYTTVESQSAGCLGDALIAATGHGLYASFKEASDNMVRIDKKYEPDMEAHEKYRFYMERYMETWPNMRDTVHKIVEHNS